MIHNYYSKEELRKIQLIELDALKEIIRVTKILNVDYFLIGGSALGAVRHKGFIPWDDDVDIGMLRDDYNLFIKEAPKYISDRYFLQTPYNEKKSPYPYAKLRVNGTTFVEYQCHNIKMNHGIYVDVFPVDEVPNDDDKNAEQFNSVQKLVITFVNRQENLPANKPRKIKSCIYCLYIKLRSLILHLISQEKLINKIDMAMTLYNGTNQSGYAMQFVPKRNWVYFSKEDLFPLSQLQFEDMVANVPGNYDKYLTNQYGDYMQFPPEAKRIAHKPYIVHINNKE